MLIRPGGKTSNAHIVKQRAKAGSIPMRVDDWWVVRVTHAHFTAADQSQVLTLNTLFPDNAFPVRSFLLDAAYFDLVEGFNGVGLTDFDLILGFTGNTNGLIEATAVEEGQDLGPRATSGDAYVAANRYQAALSPLLQADAVGATLLACSAGIVDVYIPYSRTPSSRPA